MDPAAAHGDGVLVAEPLILGVDTEIGGCISASTRNPQRRGIGFEPKRPDFDRVVAKTRLDREAPIRCNTVDRVRAHRVDAKRALRAARQTAIARQLGIDKIVEESVAAETEGASRKTALDRGGGHSAAALGPLQAP